MNFSATDDADSGVILMRMKLLFADKTSRSQIIYA